MKYVEFKNRQVIATIGQSLNLKVAAELRDELVEALQMGERSVEIDMSRTEYIDSTGLGVLVDIKERLEAVNGKIVVKGLQGYCREVFKTTRLIEDFCPGE